MLFRGVCAAALILMLASCAGIPVSGSVSKVELDIGRGFDDLVTLADSPQPGANPEEILSGFLAAQRAPSENYRVAREYLTEEFSASWSPTERVLISSSVLTESISQTGGELSLGVSVAAVVGQSGNYTELESPDSRQLKYEFERNAQGEWRISAAPEGTLVSRARFAAVFRSTSLFFFDPSLEFLVPDVRWFPQTASRVDRVVQELVQGQSPWYTDGVLLTAFPPDTRVDRVRVEQGMATVELSGGVSSSDTDTRWRMQQQLNRSLAANNISSVQLVIEGVLVSFDPGTMPLITPSVRNVPLGFSDQGLAFASGVTLEQVEGISAAVDLLEPLSVTLGVQGISAAVRNSEGNWLVRRGMEPVLLDIRQDLVDPSLDKQGYLWSATGRVDSIAAFTVDGNTYPLVAPILDGEIVSFALSRDGARLLLLTRTQAASELVLLGIVRDSDGVPTGFGEPLNFLLGADVVVDMTWVDSSTVATLSVADQPGEMQVQLHRIGGFRELFGTVSDGVQLVGGNGVEGLRVRDQRGELWRHTASGGWQATNTQVIFLATQQ